MKKYPAVFLDRDGVLTVEKGCITLPSELELCEGAAEAVGRLKSAGFLPVVLTNQSGIARGLFTEEELIEANRHLCEQTGVEAVYYCPHHISGKIAEYSIECHCRKPDTGLVEQACRDYSIDLERSWVVGDRLTDIQLGRAIGARTVLVLSIYGKEDLEAAELSDCTAVDITEAAERIILDSLERGINR